MAFVTPADMFGTAIRPQQGLQKNAANSLKLATY